MMRVLALLLVLLGVPALAAATYAQWPDQDQDAQSSYSSSSELAQAQTPRPGQVPGGAGAGGGGSKPTPSLSGGDYPGRYCCLHCRANEIACGGECLPAKINGKQTMCTKVAGCACPGKP